MVFARLASGGIPRGVATSGPAILSYGFRPFFLLAGVWAIMAMVLWVLALTVGLPIGGAIGPVNWHAHEMVFGYTGAVLAGFMLTAIPNWTGRLPVSGAPLLGLVVVWLAGRLALLVPVSSGLPFTLVIEALFLPLLMFVALREIVAGRNWKNLKILAGLAVLSSANIWFHAAIVLGADPGGPIRLAVSAWFVLIALVGGRIIPSFTRNWLARNGAHALPEPFGRYDRVSVLGLVAALAAWTIAPASLITAALCGIAAAMNCLRLVRWRGLASWSEPIVAVMHVAYLFLALGVAMIGVAAAGWMGQAAALHVALVGGIGGMTLAIMTRAALGHTGRPIRAGTTAIMAYVYIFAAALVRPLVEILPQHYYLVFATSGLLWIFAFGAFCVAYAPILWSPRLTRNGGSL